jgi:3-oxoacyl-[acyl-carrier protein] reductase
VADPAAAPAGTVRPARTALVTGATRGIGRAVALGLARAGLDVALLARDEALLAQVADEVRALGRRAVVLACDVTDAAGVADAVRRAEAPVADGGLGGVDLLVNNAGRIDTEVPAWEADVDEWWQILETNVRGPFLLVRNVVPAMLGRGGGRVIDLNSGAGTHDMTVASAYNVSKTALLRLGHHLYVAGAEQGLRVFEVAPGTVATDMTGSMPMHAERTEWTPVERTVEMVNAIAAGDLDACSGWYIRVTHDTPGSLTELAATATSAVPRHLRVLPAGAHDPLGEELTGR